MLTLLAGVVLASALVANQSAQSPIQDGQCLESAQIIAADLQKSANSISGKQLNITVVSGTLGLLKRFSEKEGNIVIVAEINAENELVIFSPFCDVSHNAKRAIIAHEVGHLVDIAVNPVPIFWRSWSSVFVPWNLRPVEIAANGYGRELLRLSGGDAQTMDLMGWESPVADLDGEIGGFER